MANLKTLLSRNTSDAIKRAREDERAECDKEKAKALDELESRLGGQYVLMVQEYDAKIESMERRMEATEAKNKEVDIERQKIRETGIRQRQVMSDLVYMVTNRHKEQTIEMQNFLRIESVVNSLERKIAIEGVDDDK